MLSIARHRITFIAGVVLLGLIANAGAEERAVPIARWFAEQPVPGEDGKTAYAPAPEWLQWEERDPDDQENPDVQNTPERWLRVNIVLAPDAPPVWCQHAGAIAELEREIPAGQWFRVSFKARAVAGASSLKVLRRWGGLTRPFWNGSTLTEEWQKFSLDLVAERNETKLINFSVVANHRGGLQPVASGEFLLADVVVEEFDPEEIDETDTDTDAGVQP